METKRFPIVKPEAPIETPPFQKTYLAWQEKLVEVEKEERSREELGWLGQDDSDDGDLGFVATPHTPEDWRGCYAKWLELAGATKEKVTLEMIKKQADFYITRLGRLVAEEDSLDGSGIRDLISLISDLPSEGRLVDQAGPEFFQEYGMNFDHAYGGAARNFIAWTREQLIAVVETFANACGGMKRLLRNERAYADKHKYESGESDNAGLLEDLEKIFPGL